MYKVTPVRTAYGKPWSQLIGEMSVNKDFLKEVGDILVKAVVKEARADLAKQGNRPTARGKAEGIPNDEKFFQSFSHRITGRSSIEIVSTWPWIEQVIQGRSPYRMHWLRQTKGVVNAPLFSEPGSRGRRAMRKGKAGSPGKVLMRTTPGKFKRGWLHPGFAKHNFVDRAFRKAKTDIDDALLKRLDKALSKSDNIR